MTPQEKQFHQEYCSEEDAANEIDINNLPDFPVYDINHVRRVYRSGDYVDNGVAKDHLQKHIIFNKTMRFGTALFVNSVCVNRGYFTQEECDEMSKNIIGLQIKVSRTIPPYK